MAPPPLWLPPRGPRDPPAPRLPQTFLLPQTFYPQGAANLCPLPRQQQPFPAAWAPSLHVAPQGPQALPPPGLQRAPCGCFFDPRVFHIEWTVTSLPPPASSTLSRGTASLPGAALWGGPRGCRTLPAWAAPLTPQGQPPHIAPQNYQGRAEAPDPPPALPTSIPGYRHIEGQPAHINSSGTATPAGAHPGTNIPPGPDTPRSPSAGPHHQAPGHPDGDFEVSEEELLQEALRLFGVSLDTVGASQDNQGSSSMPGESGGTGAEGTAVAPAPLVLPMSIPGYQHIEGQPAQTNICGTATPAGAHPDTNIPPGSYDSPSQALEDLPGDLEVSDEELLQEALSLLGCSLDGVEASHEDAGSSPMHGDRGGTGAEGNTVALASPVLPTSSAAYQHVEEQPAQLPIYGTATTAEAHLGSNTPLGSNDPSCPSAASQNQVLGDLAGDLTVSEEVPLEEALRLFGCSLDTVGTFLLPQTFYPQGAANLCPLPRQQQPFPAAWAPSLHVAPQGPQALPPPGLQRAPCGCFFDPRVFHIEWTVTSLPPPASSTLSRGTASLPGAALWGGPRGCRTLPAWAAPLTPQGQPPHIAPQNYQGRAEAPDPPPALPTSIPGYRHIEGQPAHINSSGTATPAGAHPGTNIPPGPDTPRSPSAGPHHQAPGHPDGDFEVSEEELLQEALRLFGVSLDTVGASQDNQGSSSMPGESGGTGAEGTAVAPAPLVLPMSIPGYQHIEGQPAQTNICGTATPAGAHPDTNIPPGSYDSPSQALEDLPGDLEVSDEELLQEALSLLGCSLDGVEASHEDAGSSPMHGDRGGTGAEGNTVALASPVLPTSSAAYQHVEEQPAQLPIYGTATTAEAHLGSNTPLGSNDPSCPSAASQNQVLGDLAGDLTVSEEVPLEEALRLFGCSLDTVGVSQDAFSSSSSPVPGELGGTGTATPPLRLCLALPARGAAHPRLQHPRDH
ncbi:proline-rich protein 22-like [Grus japonensis]|uniref:Proline-rich protein 22-like n=1 Tax=Grus japonensis TaxID=30415 RepID=A0ABC9Y8X7_GRUJA